LLLSIRFFFHYFLGPPTILCSFLYHRPSSSWCYRFTIFASVSQRYTRPPDETRSIYVFYNTGLVYTYYNIMEVSAAVFNAINYNNIVNNILQDVGTSYIYQSPEIIALLLAVRTLSIASNFFYIPIRCLHGLV